MMDIEEVLALFKELVLDAAKVQKKHVATSAVDFKMDKDKITRSDLGAAVVSVIDKEIQDMLLHRILDAGYDDWKVFAEEETAAVDEFSGTSDYAVFLDPIDGTLNYLLTNPDNATFLESMYGPMEEHPLHFGICLGLAHKMRMQCVVMYITTTGTLYWAVRGKGAYYNGKRIHVSPDTFSENEEFFVNSRYHDLDILPHALRAHCTSFTIARVVSGEDLCYITHTCSLYDTIPCSLLVQEAGGVVVDADGQELGVVDAVRDPERRWYLCNSRDTYKRLLELEKRKKK